MRNSPLNRFRVEVSEYDRDGWRSGYVLKVFRNGELFSEQEDNGEPEDNLFLRDYAWIKPALEQAYRFGLEDGATQENVPEQTEHKGN